MHKGGDKRGGRCRRISSDSAQNKGKHGSGKCSPKHDTDECQADSECNEGPMRPIRLPMEILFADHRPCAYAHDTDYSENHAQRKSSLDLRTHNPPPITHN